MRILAGKYLNKIDRKGRVSVPKPFRDFFQTDGGGSAGIYAFPSFKASAIEVCGEELMGQVAQNLGDRPMFSDDQDEMAWVLLGSAQLLTFDPEGRVVLPGELLEHGKLSAEALFVGIGTRFQIWNPETYKKKFSEALERVRARGATLELKPATEGQP